MATIAGPDLCYTRGDTAPIILRFRNSDGSLTDFTGFTGIRLSVTSVEDPPDASSLIIELTGSLGASQGLLEFRPASQGASDALTPNDSLFYDVEWIDAASERFTPIRGNFVIEQDRSK